MLSLVFYPTVVLLAIVIIVKLLAVVGSFISNIFKPKKDEE
jgi:hypothetical protein